jgi:DNA polymerase-3 subunit alpha
LQATASSSKLRTGKNLRILSNINVDTPVGALCIKKIQPKNLAEVAAANSLMRLMADHGQEQPIDRFIRFRADKSQWKAQMMKYGLNKSEEDLMFKYLDQAYGVAATQEDVMEMVMDEKIANFNLTEANKLRKGIAKKNKKVIEEVKAMFYNKGKETGTRIEFLNYIWEEQIKPQLG